MQAAKHCETGVLNVLILFGSTQVKLSTLKAPIFIFGAECWSMSCEVNSVAFCLRTSPCLHLINRLEQVQLDLMQAASLPNRLVDFLFRYSFRLYTSRAVNFLKAPLLLTNVWAGCRMQLGSPADRCVRPWAAFQDQLFNQLQPINILPVARPNLDDLE